MTDSSRTAVPVESGPRRQQRPVRRGATWGVPIALILYGLVPLVISVIRLVEVSGGPEGIPPDPRFTADPAPIVLHVLSVVAYSVLGAFQFSAGIRRRHLRWHRWSGRVLVPTGLVVAASALWMALGYPLAEGTHELLFWIRVTVALAMGTCIVLGFRAIRRRQVRRHRAWMMRAYALGLGAASQAFTLGFGQAVLGHGPLVHALLMGAGWGINLVVAELLIRRPRRGVRRRAARRRAPAVPVQRGASTTSTPAGRAATES